jgi:DNA-binding response OmpR family regulator
MNILPVEDDLDPGNAIRIAPGDQGFDMDWVRRLA